MDEPICPVIKSIREKMLADDPDPELISDAIAELNYHDLANVPAWIPVLAGANVYNWPEAVDEVRRWIKAEDEPPHHPGDAPGQSIVETALLLGLAAAVILILMAWLPTTPAGQAMAALAADAVSSMEATVDQSLSHGVAKHGAQAQSVYNCINKFGVYQVWYNPTTNRRANLCQTEDGRWGAQIVNADNQEITAFINRCKVFREFAEYLRNAGYQPMQ